MKGKFLILILVVAFLIPGDIISNQDEKIKKNIQKPIKLLIIRKTERKMQIKTKEYEDIMDNFSFRAWCTILQPCSWCNREPKLAAY